jgi:hypothetical protein
MRRIPNPDTDLKPGTKSFEDGDMCIIVSPPYAGEGWHLSFSLSHKSPTPTQVKATLDKLRKEKIIPYISAWSLERGTVNRNVIHLRQKIDWS